MITYRKSTGIIKIVEETAEEFVESFKKVVIRPKKMVKVIRMITPKETYEYDPVSVLKLEIPRNYEDYRALLTYEN